MVATCHIENAGLLHAIRTDYFQATMGTCKIFFSVTASYRILPMEGSCAALRAANERLTSGKRLVVAIGKGGRGEGRLGEWRSLLSRLERGARGGFSAADKEKRCGN